MTLPAETPPQQNPPETSLALNRLLLFQPPAPSPVPAPAPWRGRNATPFISNRDADWDRLIVEKYQVQSSGELDLPARRHHAVTCQIGGPCRVSRKYRGQSDERIFAPGDFSLCPAGEPASLRWQEKADILQVLLPTHWVAETHVMLGGALTAEPLRVSFGTASPQIVHTALALQAELEGGCPGGPLLAETLASAFAVCLLRCAGAQPLPTKEHGGGLGRADLARVLTHISDHLAEDLSLQELAACARLSVYHFARLFKLSTGLPPHEYVLRQRVGRAKSLLAARKMTVGEVAQAVGFFDHSSLCRHFKRLTGVAPSRFQRQ